MSTILSSLIDSGSCIFSFTIEGILKASSLFMNFMVTGNCLSIISLALASYEVIFSRSKSSRLKSILVLSSPIWLPVICAPVSLWIIALRTWQAVW